jgi:hypothetical protein
MELSADTSNLLVALALGVLFMIGLVECFFGFTLFRITIAVVGFIVGGAAGYWAVYDMFFIDWLGLSPDDDPWIMYVAAVMALVVAFVMMCLAFIITVIGVFVLGMVQFTEWIGLDWIGLDWIGLDWIGLDWIGLDWIGLG